MPKKRAQKEPPLEEAIELTREMEDVIELARVGADSLEIANEFDMPLARVKRILQVPIVIERLRFLLADKYDTWNKLGEDLYLACMENLIAKARDGKLTEKTLMAMISRQETKQGVFDDRTEVRRMTISEKNHANEIPESVGKPKTELFNKRITVEQRTEKPEG